MLAAQRKDLLLDRLTTRGRIVAREVAEELGLSEDSIRRDLRELAPAGLSQRVYGVPCLPPRRPRHISRVPRRGRDRFLLGR